MLLYFFKAIDSLDGDTYTFHFNRLTRANKLRYHISVRSSSHSAHYFMMEKMNSGWHFTNIHFLPPWIREIENELELAIKENL
jgi:hypothetical protein